MVPVTYDAFDALGPWWVLMGAAFAAGLFVPLVLAALTALRVRFPLLLWLAGPTLTLAAGLPPGHQWVSRGLRNVGIAELHEVLWTQAWSYSNGVIGPATAALAASCTLLVAAAALAAGVSVSARPGRYAVGPAAACAAVAVIGALGTGGWAVVGLERPPLLVLPAAGLVGGLAAAAGGLRIAEEAPDAGGAASRAMLAVLALLAIALLATGLSMEARSDLLSRVASVEHWDRVDRIEVGWRSIRDLHAVAVATGLWVAAAVAVPAVAAVPQLWPMRLRTVADGLGAVLLIALSALALAGTGRSLAVVVQPQAGLLEAARRQPELPVARLGTQELIGSCLLTPTARGWSSRPPAEGEGCAEGDAALPIDEPLPVVALPPDAPALVLATGPWSTADHASVGLLIRTGADLPDDLPDALAAHRYGVFLFEWRSPGGHEPAWYLVDTADGPVGIVGGVAHPFAAEAVHEQLLQLHTSFAEPVFVPGPSWTVQDVTDLCATLWEKNLERGAWVSCALQAAP